MVRTSGSSAACWMKPLDRVGERLVGVVDEDVALADAGEDVDALVLLLLALGQARRHHRRPRRRLQLGDVEVGDGLQPAQVEHAPDLVDVGRVQAQAALQQGARLVRHGALDLEAHDLAEAAPAQLLLHGHEQVVGLVLLDVEVGVAGDAEEVVRLHLHAREEHVEVGRDDALQQHVRARRHLPHARQHRRHLDAREAALAAGGVAHRDRQRQRQVADVGEGMRGVHRQRRQDREDLVHEALAQLVLALGPVLRAAGCGCPLPPAPR